MSLTLIGGTILIGLSLMEDSKGTITLVTAVIGIRGVTWICKKAIESIDYQSGELINFTGWCIAGVSIVGIIKNAMLGVTEVMDKIDKGRESIESVSENVNNVVKWFEIMAEYADKITFWN